MPGADGSEYAEDLFQGLHLLKGRSARDIQSSFPLGGIPSPWEDTTGRPCSAPAHLDPNMDHLTSMSGGLPERLKNQNLHPQIFSNINTPPSNAVPSYAAKPDELTPEMRAWIADNARRNLNQTPTVFPGQTTHGSTPMGTPVNAVSSRSSLWISQGPTLDSNSSFATGGSSSAEQQSHQQWFPNPTNQAHHEPHTKEEQRHSLDFPATFDINLDLSLDSSNDLFLTTGNSQPNSRRQTLDYLNAQPDLLSYLQDSPENAIGSTTVTQSEPRPTVNKKPKNTKKFQGRELKYTDSPKKNPTATAKGKPIGSMKLKGTDSPKRKPSDSPKRKRPYKKRTPKKDSKKEQKIETVNGGTPRKQIAALNTITNGTPRQRKLKNEYCLQTPKAKNAAQVPMTDSRVLIRRSGFDAMFPRTVKKTTCLKRLPYNPFMKCQKHELCKMRQELTFPQLENGYYFKSDKFPLGDGDGENGDGNGENGHLVQANRNLGQANGNLAQACMDDGTPYTRKSFVEDTYHGLANLMQLHMVKALEQRNEHRRPLLLPSMSSATTTNPVHRLLQSKRFYCGRFFNDEGFCQTEECILISVPKNHRGDVRLQMKVWEDPALAKAMAEASEAKASKKKDGSSKEKKEKKEKKEDIKAHLLSYICWLYGLSNQTPTELGQWPTKLVSTCKWGHKPRNNDDNDEFLCLNPFHYCAENGGGKDENLRKRIEDRICTCVKDEPPIEGERLDENGQCVCFCMKCRDHRSEIF